ncbi:helix-turn-helix transcriptional regulator [Bradyrhizobium sp. U87765 SZCCT0131]|uniref:AraC family transcriptional regulator n=1 Tax=unclassified Bradyrhizobium TaxID=2631580 RepID=UPI001BA63FC3|nr:MULTISPECIES: helix-turn-helix transcriptional regulator [unclassified Bradyrhizobium]MBR1218901.1 helix-turn-helix transcriptional regulator [Bradyrhizobium sp. U87765 SZCCT0131]MBR1261552.1 helix-turn-helix transcriptional regulator [Bradyrhizobium sp. U87765 SZCCT0134]MBR1306595.1 helix-turn-helix transcriptional regulator [Bradyrhizobium sp. U87765 SZCCT0110]MBR1317334.1 helix-turn-helix transcriptional regulator [Bradyrhizobium sp. U87765 SZCCT0109]MBR1351036.1 helix-turn-helix transcr
MRQAKRSRESASGEISGAAALAALDALPRSRSGGFRFAFGAADAPRRHAHAHGQLAFAPTDLVTIVVADRLWMTSPTSAVWIPPRVLHEVHATSGREMCSLYLAPRMAARLPATPSTLAVSPLLRELLLRLAGDTTTRSARTRFVAAALVEIAAGLRAADRSTPQVAMPVGVPRLQPIADALAADPADMRSLDDWARILGSSTRTLSRAIRAATGLSWREWRLRLRMIDAARRLATGAPVKTIAHDVGYGTPTAFIAAFARMFGSTPGEALPRRR